MTFSSFCLQAEEEKKSIKEKMQAMQEIALTIQVKTHYSGQNSQFRSKLTIQVKTHYSGQNSLFRLFRSKLTIQFKTHYSGQN